MQAVVTLVEDDIADLQGYKQRFSTFVWSKLYAGIHDLDSLAFSFCIFSGELQERDGFVHSFL